MKTAFLAFACVLAVGLSGCGGSDPKPKANTSVPPTGQPTGMLQGTLQMVGGPAGVKADPVPGTITITGPGGSVTKTQVDPSGNFAIGLYPGSYRVEGTSPSYDDGKGRCATSNAKTTLTAGSTVTVTVDCVRK